MSTAIPFSVDEYSLSSLQGLSVPTYAALLDVSAPEIATQFTTLVNVVSNYLLPGTAATATNRALLEQAVTQLRDMLTKGYTPPGGTGPEYLTTPMADQLNPLFSSLTSAGVTIGSSNPITFPSDTILQAWKTAANSSAVLLPLFEFISNNANRSLQAMIELDYVAAGNELLASQMNELQSALAITKAALGNLTMLQTLKNNVQISNTLNFGDIFNITQTTGISVASYQANYTKAASAYFGAPIQVSTPILPIDVTKTFLLTDDIPADTVPLEPGNYPTLTNQLSPYLAYANVDTGSSVYAKYNSTDNNFDLYYLPTTGYSDFSQFLSAIDSGSLSPIQQDFKISGLASGASTIIYINKYGNFTNPDVPVRTNPFADNHDLLAGNVTITDSDGYTFNWTITYNQSYSADFYNGMISAKALSNNFTVLSTGNNTTYYGLKNASSASVQSATTFFNTHFTSSDTPVQLKLSSFDFDITQSISETSKMWMAYDSIKKKFIRDARDPTVMFEAVQQLADARTALSSQIASLELTTPTLPDGTADPNTLLAKLKIILSDLNKSFTSTGTAGGTPIDPVTHHNDIDALKRGLEAWLIDNRNSNGVLQAGAYQQNLQFGITAASSLNDTQNESIRNFLFIFEEYYKSASAILQQITQILQKIAQNIARQESI